MTDLPDYLPSCLRNQDLKYRHEDMWDSPGLTRGSWDRIDGLQGWVNPASLPNPLGSGCSPRLCPLSFGEGVELDPLPPTEVRYTSSVKYDSERHFIDDIQLPLGLAVASCSQTITCIPSSTWRNYKAEVRFEPRHKPTRFLSTTIVYPKYPKTVYTTTLDYNCRKTLRRFLSSVELEATEFAGGDYLLEEN
ncbi:hypothetical protein E5288_WYG020828 [Bos mutus]|uniref:Protein FAM101B n=1 Tax=Bos mutus TaxID=72004 RepID=A0A6B0R370_9CETA|nr:hypothetical protein [Bos mutus]